MKRKISLFLVVIVMIALALASQWPSHPLEFITVQNPCNTFVSEFAPVVTPELRPTREGMELVVSFTPAQDREADAVRFAVDSGTKKLIVYPTNFEVEALRIEDGRFLVLAVKSAEHAKEVLGHLCFVSPNPSFKRDALKRAP